MTDPTTPAIYAAMIRVMADVGPIAKSRKNTQQNYSFRGIDDLYAALQGPLIRHGVFCVPTVMDSQVRERDSKNGGTLIYTTLKVSHRFYALDGSSVEAVTIGEAMDSGDKSSNKAMSAAMKYALLEVFCIPTEGDNDSENHTHEVARKHQAAPSPSPAFSPAIPSRSGPDMAASRTPTAPTATPPATSATPRSDAGHTDKDACDEMVTLLRELAGDKFAVAVWRAPDPVSHVARHRLLTAAVRAMQTIDAEHQGNEADRIIGDALKRGGWTDETTDKAQVRAAVAELVKAAGLPAPAAKPKAAKSDEEIPF